MILFYTNKLNSILTQHYGFAMTTTKRIFPKMLHKWWVPIKIKKKEPGFKSIFLVLPFFSGALAREAP